MGKGRGIPHRRFFYAAGAVLVWGMLAAPVGHAGPQASGNGLYAEYYDVLSPTNGVPTGAPTGSRTEILWINFGPGGAFATPPGQPPAGITSFASRVAGMNEDNNFIRWRGEIEPEFTETYTFTLHSDDNAALWIGATQVIASGFGTRTGTIALTGGTRYPIMVEFFEFGGDARIALEWQSASRAREIVPQARLYSGPLVAAPTITPNGGTGPVTVTLASATPGATLYYTLDGTDPGPLVPGSNAIPYTGPFVVDVHGRIRVRAYAPGMISTETISNPFLKAIDPVTVSGTVPGVYYRYYHSSGTWGPAIPNFEALFPQQRGIMPQFSIVPGAPLPPRDRNDNFGFKFNGYIQVPTDGVYNFYTTSDDGSKLWIGPIEVVNNEGFHGMQERGGQIYLRAGLHPITVVHFEGGGGEGLEVRYDGPGIAKQIIPGSVLFSDPASGACTLSPAPGTFTGSQSVTITGPSGATIYYTLDGSAPDPRLAHGQGTTSVTVLLDRTTTVRALAVEPGKYPGPIVAGTYTRTDVFPSPIAAIASGINTEVEVLFDRTVTNPSASTASNYTIDNGVSVSAASLIPRNPSLRAWWKLDDTSGADSSGNGNTGTVNGATVDTANVAPLAFANPASLSFNGTSNYVSVPDSASLDVGTRSFTVTAWIRTTNNTGPRSVVNKWLGGSSNIGWRMDVHTASGDGNAPGNLRFRLRDGTNNTDVSVGAGIANNTWYHVAARVDRQANQLRLYVNGVNVGGTFNLATGLGNLNAATQVGIGTIPSALGAYFAGQIDDVRIYDVALSDIEIAGLAAGAEDPSNRVRLTTSALTADTPLYTLTTNGISGLPGTATGAASIPFRYRTGTLARERWDGIGGGSVFDLLRNANYPDNPSQGSLIAPAEVPATSPNVDNFGTRLRGYFIPNATGNWRFAIASDDNSQLWLSPDDDPAKKVLVSRCNAWSGYRDYADADIVQSGPIPLVAGRKYFLEAIQKEGGGGDHVSIAAKLDDGTPIAAGTASLPASMIAPYIEPVRFTSAHLSRVVEQGWPVALPASAVGTGRTLQWQKDGTNIAGATGNTLTIASPTPADNGTYTVTATNSVTSITSGPMNLTVNPLGAPTVTSVSPSFGPSWGGQLLVITGTNFLPGRTTVTIGGVSAVNHNVPFYLFSATTILAVTPPHAPGTVDVVVTTPGGTATATGAYTYYGLPTISAVSPSVGPVAGGQTVTITGTNFVPANTTVTFDGTPGTGVSVAPDGQSLTVTTPAHVEAPVDVVITTPFGAVTAASGYEYFDPPTIASVTPAEGPSTGGTSVTITGTDFATGPGQTAVTFGGAPAAITSITRTQIVVTAPARPSPPPPDIFAVTLQVATAGGSVSSTYTYYEPPTIASLSPANGPSTGGQSVTITGTNFSTTPGATTVTFGTLAAAISSMTNTQIVVTTPANAAGVVTVTVSTTGGNATANYQYHDAPTITSINPAAGPSAGGQAVSIGGTNFVPGLTTVSFGGAAATVNAVTSTSLSVTTPPHAAGGVSVVVTTPGGTATTGYAYHDPPTVTGVSPSSGPTQGGQTVTITGTNFVSGSTTVSFGGVAGTNVTVSSPTSLTVDTPAHATGAVEVVVTTPGGSDADTNTYTYTGPFIQTISPDNGPAAGGQALTITGTGFIPGSTTVTFGGNPAAVNSATSTSLSVTTPAGSGTVGVTVTTPDGSYTASNAYTYLGAPTVSSISPSRGPTAGGQTVTITGTNFSTSSTTVTFAGAPATITAITTTQITVSTPPGTAGTASVTVTTFGSQSATGTYTYVSPPTVASLIPIRGPTSGGQVVTITGTNFEAGATAVSFGGALAGGVTVVSPTQLSATTPPHAAGVVDVVVQTFGSASSQATLAGGYRYVDPAGTADLSLSMSVDRSEATVGQSVAFTLVLTNSGPQAATGVQVTGLLPPGLSFSAAVASSGTYSATTGVWNLGGLASGASATLSIQAVVASSADHVLTAEVTAASPEDVDSIPANGLVGEDDLASATVRASLGIVTAALPSVTAGAYYHQTVQAAGGAAPYAWSLVSGTLPFALDPSTGVVSGFAPEVSSATTYVFTLSVADSDSPPSTATATLSITVNPANTATPTLTTSSPLPDATRGLAYELFLAAADGRPPYLWRMAAGSVLPAGLSLDPATGRLAGVPGATGSFSFTIEAVDGGGRVGAAAFNLTVVPNAVSIRTLYLAAGAIGSPYSRSIEASGGLGPTFAWSVSSGALPPGLSLSGTGRTATLAGTPSLSGTFTFTLQVSDDGQTGVTASQSFVLEVRSGGGPVEVTPMVLPAATEGRPYAATLTAVGGPAPYFWSLAGGALPSGVTLSSSGAIGGTPTQAGAFGFTARAERAAAPAQNDSEDFTLIVAPAPIIVTPDPLPGAVRNEGYFVPLAVSGGVGPFQWALASGSVLPAGLTLDPTGVIHGVPTGTGGSFTVEVMDVNGAVASKAFTLAVADPSAGLAVVGALPAGTVGVPYSAALRAVGGTPPYVWSVLAGALPAWAVLDPATGVVSGTPSAVATSTLELGVTDSAVAAPGSASSGPQTLDVRGFLTVTTVGLPPAAQGQAYSASLGVAGASGPVVWALLDGALPAGVSLDSGTGILSGVPQGTGTVSFLVRATDGAGRSAFRRLTLSVGTGAGGAVLGGSTGRECSVASAGSAAPGQAALGALLAALVSALFGWRKGRREVGR